MRCSDIDGTPGKCCRDWLTFAEAMEALKAGKKVRADEMTDGYWWELAKGAVIMRCGVSRGSALLQPELLSWHFHVVDDTPPKTRAREMAEAYKQSIGVDEDDAELIAREMVEAVLTVMEGDGCIFAHRERVRREFLEPRRK